MMCPHPGQVIGLQFQANRPLVILLLGQRPPFFVDDAAVAEKVLHMMSHFVGDNVGLRELGIRASEFLFQLIKEGRIEINGSVRRAVERANRRRRDAAPGLYLVGEKHHVRRRIMFADLAELFTPDLLRESKDGGEELATAFLLSGWRTPLDLALVSAPVRLTRVEEVIELLRINAQKGTDQQNDQRANAAANRQLLGA